MANTFRKVYKKTGNLGTSSDYQLVGNIGVNGVELDIMKGASYSTAGEIGLVPKPTTGVFYLGMLLLNLLILFWRKVFLSETWIFHHSVDGKMI